jgi:23S rRNA (uracil1939-C5)-methyltransferase
MSLNQPCRHFGQCGGCSFRDVPYAEQLAGKDARVLELLGPLASASVIHAIHPSPVTAYYRNKMEYTLSRDQDSQDIICGLHRTDSRRQIVDMKECLLFSEDVPLLVEAVCRWADQRKYSFFSTWSHKGFLRYLILRKTHATRELMVNVVTSSQEQLDAPGLVERLNGLDLGYTLKSVYHTVSDALSDAVVPDDVRLLWGQPRLTERMQGLSFAISPFTFFQVNPAALEEFYPCLKEQAGLTPDDVVLDLYCGIGTIGLQLAPRCKYVWGVEAVEASVRDAFENSASNGITNISFMAGDTRRILYEQESAWQGKVSVVVINPPRSGTSPRVVKRIMNLNPRRIVYSSCNIASMAADIRLLSERYQPMFIKPFDFFPHTRHFEVLAVLDRK